MALPRITFDGQTVWCGNGREFTVGEGPFNNGTLRLGRTNIGQLALNWFGPKGNLIGATVLFRPGTYILYGAKAKRVPEADDEPDPYRRVLRRLGIQAKRVSRYVKPTVSTTGTKKEYVWETDGQVKTGPGGRYRGYQYPDRQYIESATWAIEHHRQASRPNHITRVIYWAGCTPEKLEQELRRILGLDG